MNGVWILDADFTEKLKNVLSNPDAMSKIASIASGLTKSDPEIPSTAGESSASESNPLPNLPLPAFSADSDPRIALLSSIKPLLREDKRSKIDSLTRALMLSSMMKSFRK